MRFVVQINAGPYQHQACASALAFTRAALTAGHQVTRVFFYHDAVNVATRLATPPQDEQDLTRAWRELASDNQLDLVVCVAAAQRRGIVDDGEAQRNGKDATNIAPKFRISGLGQLVEGAIQSDRLVVFGD